MQFKVLEGRKRSYKNQQSSKIGYAKGCYKFGINILALVYL